MAFNGYYIVQPMSVSNFRDIQSDRTGDQAVTIRGRPGNINRSQVACFYILTWSTTVNCTTGPLVIKKNYIDRICKISSTTQRIILIE